MTANGTTRERRRQRTRALILQSAEELLAEGGLLKLTLAELAERAAYSKPAIYEYFGSLEDVLIELNNSGFARLGQRVQAAPHTLPPDQRLLAIANEMLRFAAENVELYQLMFTHIIFSPGRMDRNWEETKQENEVSYRVALQVIQEGIDQGIFVTRPGFDLYAMTYMCWATIHGLASLRPSMVAALGLDQPHNHDLVLNFMIANLKGVVPTELPAPPAIKELAP